MATKNKPAQKLYGRLGEAEIQDILIDPDVSDLEMEFEGEEDDLAVPVSDGEPDADDIGSTSASEDDEPVLSPEGSRPLWRHINEFHPPNQVANQPSQPATDFMEVKKPFVYFSRYLDSTLFEEMALYTNRKSVLDTGKSLDTNAEEISTFWGCSIVAGLLSFPRLRMCWESRTRFPLIADNISRDRFYSIRKSLKVVDDNVVTNEMKEHNSFWKVQPILDRVRNACLENPRPKDISVDEQMIPFHGHVRMRQYVKGKPHPVGLKNFVSTSTVGLPLDFHLYEGKGSQIISEKVPLPEKLDIGGRVVLKLSDTLPSGCCIFMDRYFTSVALLELLLSHRSILASGTIMSSRLPKCVRFKSDKEMKKQRGSFDQVVRRDDKLGIVKWYDNRPIFLASTEYGVEPVEECRRWSKRDHAHIQIPRPNLVKQYNANMGGVDLLNKITGKYPMRGRTKKWTIRVMHHFFDFVTAACWIEYRTAAKEQGMKKKDIMPYFQFKMDVAENLIYPKFVGRDDDDLVVDEDSDEEPRASVPKRHAPTPLPPVAKRSRHAMHLPQMMTKCQTSRSRCRASGCSKLTFVRCSDCKVFLCFNAERNCFMDFHQT